MAKRNLTDRTLQALKPAAEGTRYEYRDAVVPGLTVRVTANGQDIRAATSFSGF